MHESIDLKLKLLKRNYIYVLIILFSIISFSLAWNIYTDVRNHKNLALEHAKNSFVKDLMFRKWVASHGGVYVIPTERTPPNPYLKHLKNRDFTTTTGEKLTLMNPAYTLRQLMNEYEGMYGAKGHITSLNLLNPDNKPSQWEAKSLTLFNESDKEEVHEFVTKDDKEYIYYMKALVTKESCLKCHAQQGYKVGDIRGGVSVIIPMKKYNDDIAEEVTNVTIFHILFFIVTLVILFFTYKDTKKTFNEQERLYQENKRKEEIMLAQSRSAAMGDMISMIAHQWRQPIAVIAMWANNIAADVDLDAVDNKSLEEYSSNIVKQTNHLSSTIDDFKNFFKPNKDKDEVILKDVMEDCLAVINKSLENNNIKVEKNYNSDTLLKIYSRELMQVYLNIIKNSKEALLDNKIKDSKITIDIYEKDDYIVTDIKDNGLGIKESIIHRVFDPYFTTKDVSSGTGLGLYMSKMIIEKHLHGQLTVENIESGACFTILLPKENI